MATIEIDLAEYNSYHKAIDDLNKEKFELKKEIIEKDEKIEELRENIEIAKKANIIDRVFSWKQIKNLISEE